MLEDKRLFIFADENLSNKLTDFFLVPMNVANTTIITYCNFSNIYHKQEELINMIQHHQSTNLFYADYFFIDFDYIKERLDLLDVLINHYHKPVVLIFRNLVDVNSIHGELIFKICMDTFDYDMNTCVTYLDDCFK